MPRSLYSLAIHSRRRRLMVAYGIENERQDHFSEAVMAGASNTEMALRNIVDPELDAALVNNAIEESFQAKSETAAGSMLGQVIDRIDDPAPITWLFAGSNYQFDARHVKRSCIEFFSDFVKHRAGRRMDVIVDSTYADHRLVSFQRNIDWRVSRFQPDIVIVNLSVTDLAAECASFENNLTSTIRTLLEENTLLVVCSPPPSVQQSGETVQKNSEVVATVCEAENVAMIDHFEYWSKTVDKSSQRELVIDDQVKLEGHQKLTRLLLRRLCMLE